MSFLHQIFDFTLKLLSSTTKEGFFSLQTQDLAQDLNGSCDGLGDLYNAMK